MRLLSASALVAEAGITYRQLDYWVTKGWLKPHVIEERRDEARIRAHRRIFGEGEIRVAQLLAALADRDLIAERLRDLAETGSMSIGGVHLRLGEDEQ